MFYFPKKKKEYFYHVFILEKKERIKEIKKFKL